MDNRLRELREGAGLTQAKLADLVNTTHSTIQRFEAGTRQMTEGWLRKLATALRCRPGDILDAPKNGGIDRDRMREAICGTLSAIRKRGIAPTEDEVADLIFYVYDLEEDGEAVEKVVDFTAHRLSRR